MAEIGFSPEKNLEEQLTLAKEISEGELLSDDENDRLAGLVIALDKWLCSGGSLPKRWRDK